MPYKRKTAASTAARKPAQRRYTRNVRGKGSYIKTPKYTYNNPGPWGRAGRAVGSIAGRALSGSSAGAKIGSAIGGLAHYVGRVFGSGEYRIGPAPKFNSLFKGSVKPSELSFGDRYVNLKHREFIGDVITSSTAGEFSIQKFEVNPGLQSTFPYLAHIARNFQMYRFKGLLFEYVSTSGSGLNSTNTALGSVMMVPEYNVYSAIPKTKHEILNTEGNLSGKPSDSLVIGVECDPRKGNASEMFVRSLHTTAVQSDRRLSDICNMYIATFGMQGTGVNVGQLYVTYDVDLMMPVTERPGSFDPQTQIIYQGVSGNQLSSWPVPPYNDNESSTGYNVSSIKAGGAYNALGIVVRYDSGSQANPGDPGGSYICFPRDTVGGYFRISVLWNGTSTTLNWSGTALHNGLISKGVSYDTNGSVNERMQAHYNVYVPQTCVWGDDDTGVTWPSFQLRAGQLPAGMETGRINLMVFRLNPGMLDALLPPGATGNALIV